MVSATLYNCAFDFYKMVYLYHKMLAIFWSTQRAVLQESCSTVGGTLLGKFCSSFMCFWQNENRLLGDFFGKLFVKWALSPRSSENLFRTLGNP